MDELENFRGRYVRRGVIEGPGGKPRYKGPLYEATATVAGREAKSYVPVTKEFVRDVPDFEIHCERRAREALLALIP